jgi:hypothetical protein
MTLTVEFKGNNIVVTRRIKVHGEKFVIKTTSTGSIESAVCENLLRTRQVIQAHRDTLSEEAKSLEEELELETFQAALDKRAEELPAQREKTGPDLAEPVPQVGLTVEAIESLPKAGESKSEFVQRCFARLAPNFEKIFDMTFHPRPEEKRGTKTPPSVPSTPLMSSPMPGTPLPASAEPTEDQFGAELTESTLFSSSPLPVRASSPTKVSKLVDKIKFDNLILPNQPDWLKFHE